MDYQKESGGGGEHKDIILNVLWNTFETLCYIPNRIPDTLSRVYNNIVVEDDVRRRAGTAT